MRTWPAGFDTTGYARATCRGRANPTPTVVGHIDEFITYVIERGRVRIARFQISLAGEKESPVEPSRLLGEIGRIRPDLITLVGAPDDAAKLIEQIGRGGSKDPVLLLVPMPKRTAAQPVARVGVIVPDAAQTRDLQPVIRSLLYALCLNPKTQLLSNQAMEAYVARRIRAREDFGFFYVDIDRFKDYNDTYGFARGDGAIDMLAGAIRSAIDEQGTPEDLAGHIGGDDFVVLSRPDRARPVAETVLEQFRTRARSLYSPEEQAKGYTMAYDRQARKKVKRSFMTVSIGLLVTEVRWPESYLELSDRVSELNKFAKEQGGDRIEEERRKDGPKDRGAS